MNVTDAGKKRAILLSLCEAGTYEIIKSLVAPKKPTEHTYAQLVKVVKAHFQPTPSEIISRYHFNRRVREPGESVAKYNAELRRMTEHCSYGDMLEMMLRDRLVSSINDKKILSRLLQEGGKLTFTKAKELTLALESTERDAKDLQADPSPVEAKVLAVHQPPPLCHQCGGKHLPSAC